MTEPMTPITTPPATPPAGSTPPARPDHIPEKFWNAEKGEANIAELAKAHGVLEQERTRLSQQLADARKKDVPDRYHLTAVDGLPLDDSFQAEAKALGLSQDEMTRNLELLGKTLAPKMREMREGYETRLLGMAWGLNDAAAVKAKVLEITDAGTKLLGETAVKGFMTGADGLVRLAAVVKQMAQSGNVTPGVLPQMGAGTPPIVATEDYLRERIRAGASPAEQRQIAEAIAAKMPRRRGS